VWKGMGGSVVRCMEKGDVEWGQAIIGSPWPQRPPVGSYHSRAEPSPKPLSAPEGSSSCLTPGKLGWGTT
jgi:hypothetical protein